MADDKKQTEKSILDTRVVITRDFWDEDGERHKKGKIIKTHKKDAMQGIQDGRYVVAPDEKKDEK